VSLPPEDDLLEHLAGLRRVARALCAQEADADDVVQEGALAALQAPLTRPRSLGAWLGGLGRNLARGRGRSESRRSQRERAAARDEAVASAQARAERLELATRLVACVRELPENQAEVIFLHFWEGLPPRAIAARLGVNVETIKTRQKRALHALRERLSVETPGGRERWLSALAALPAAALETGGASGAAWTAAGAVLMKKFALAVAVALVGSLAWWTLRTAQLEPMLEPPAAPAPMLAQDDLGGERETAQAPVASDAERKPAVEVVAPVAGKWLIVGRVVNMASETTAPEPAAFAEVHTMQGGLIGLGEVFFVSTRCDEQGRFRLEVDHALAPAFSRPNGLTESDLEVEAAGDAHFRAAQASVKVHRGAAEVLEVVLERYSYGGLAGVTVDPLGAPVAGVAVSVQVDDRVMGSATSDDAGRFAIVPLTSQGDLFAVKDGWAVIQAGSPQPLEHGRWKDVKVVLAPAASLALQVVDASDVPVEGTRVSVDLSPTERYGTDSASSFGANPRPLHQITDAHGAAHYPSVWAGLELRVVLYSPSEILEFERESLGLLERSGVPRGPSSRSIVLEAGRDARLRIAVGDRSKIRGRVVKQDGSPVPLPAVRVYAPRQPEGMDARVIAFVHGDEQGRFELAWSSFAPLGAGRLAVCDKDLLFGFSNQRGEAAPLIACLELDLDAPPEEELVVVLEPTLAIEGRVLDPEGRGARATVRARPHGDPASSPLLRMRGVQTQVWADADGSFCFVGLPAGSFDIAASSDDWARAVVEDVPAGTTDLELRVSGARPVTVEVEIVCPSVELKQAIVLRGELDAFDSSRIDAPALAAQSSYTDPLGWPQTALGLYYGSEGDLTEDGSVMFNYWPIEGSSTKIELEEGLYWFGAKGRAANGSELFPVGTGLVRVAQGTYKLRFELAPTTTLEGRVSGPGAADLAAALYLPDGRPLPLDVRRNTMQAEAELGAQGTFYFARVPAGELELRLGTPDELRAGRSRWSRTIEARSGEPLKLEIEL
jgi:RNA polymerase sigma factor (sigma-70 family)